MIPKRHWAISCSTYVAKRYVAPFIDGVHFSWKAYILMVDAVKHLQPGHLIWHSYKKKWTTIDRIEWISEPIYRIRQGKKEHYAGTYLVPQIYLEDGYLLYGIDQWLYDFCRGIEEKDREEFFSSLAKFNAQFGKHPFWAGPYFLREWTKADWLKVIKQRGIV